MASPEFHALQERLASQPPPPPPADLDEQRARIDTSMAALPLAEGSEAEEVEAGGVPSIWVRPVGAGPDTPVIVYLHGGGFRLASAVAYRSYGSHLAAATGARVLLVDYGLAPEHPFPEGLEDVVSAYRWVLAEGTPAGKVVLAGDSAGGNLAAAAVLALKERSLPLPAGAVCCSPWVDLTNGADTYRTRADVDRLFSLASATEAAELYLGGGDPRRPLVSPVFGDWSGAPPLLIQVGDAEVLLDDAARLAEAARAAGVEVAHHVYPEMPHIWQMSYPAFPEAVDAVAEIAGFVARCTG